MREILTQQTEKEGDSARDTNVTNKITSRKERKQCARYKHNKQTEKKEKSARDTNETYKQKRKETVREVLT